ARAAGTPCTEGTGPICRIPSRGFSPTRLGLLTQGHLCQFLVRSHGLTPTPFSRAPRISGRACAPTPACIPFSPLRHSGDFNGESPGKTTPPTAMRPALGRDPHGAGILTCFPFAFFG